MGEEEILKEIYSRNFISPQNNLISSINIKKKNLRINFHLPMAIRIKINFYKGGAHITNRDNCVCKFKLTLLL